MGDKQWLLWPVLVQSLIEALIEMMFMLGQREARASTSHSESSSSSTGEAGWTKVV